jgi:hypothetical protein
MLGMLVKIFGSYAVSGNRGFPRQPYVLPLTRVSGPRLVNDWF